MSIPGWRQRSTPLRTRPSSSNTQACSRRAREGEPAFDGTSVAALYWFVFPNLMLNFYPWGLSLNLVEPQSPQRTRVRFRSYVGDAARGATGAGGALDLVEAQDESIVEAVQRGVRSRLYRGGRYSPAHERGVHHFHRLLCRLLGVPS